VQQEFEIELYCTMNSEFTITKTNQVILEDNSQFFYTIKSFELKNSLGNIVAVLKEYAFTKDGESNERFCHKLYKTKDGNWYEINDKISSDEYDILRRLKVAIDTQKPAL
jgi:hypothetical protein